MSRLRWESEENNEEENDREGEEQLSRYHLFNVYSSLIRACQIRQALPNWVVIYIVI